jgi:16S rRNA processing protein RimM
MAERAGRRRRTTKAAPARPAEPVGAAPRQAPRMVPVAEVARAHGLGGELRLRLYNPDSELFEQLDTVELTLPDGTSRPVELLSLRYASGSPLVTIDGVNDRDAAEALRGAVLSVSREVLGAALGEPEPDEFFACDLEHCRVLLAGVPFGAVESVAHYPTCDALVVARLDGSRLEVPMHENYVAEIRVSERTVELRTVEGLE